MRKKNETLVLNEKIIFLQCKQADELVILKEQFHSIYENLKPINLLKNTLQNITSSPDIKSILLNSAIGITTGFLSKKILIGSSSNPIKKLLGNVLEFTIASVVAKYFNLNKSGESSVGCDLRELKL